MGVYFGNVMLNASGLTEASIDSILAITIQAFTT